MKNVIVVIAMMAVIAGLVYGGKADAPGLNKVQVEEFVPFTHDFGEGAYTTEDYEAIANQKVVYVGDVVRHEGRKYVALQNHNTYPDEFNTQGNPFNIITDQAFNDGFYFRVKSNESTCIEKVTLSGLEDINDMHVWKIDWYTKTISQTEICSGYGTLEPYINTGQLATALYGAVALGTWAFRIDNVMYSGYKRDFVIVPTPNTPEADGFWERYKK